MTESGVPIVAAAEIHRDSGGRSGKQIESATGNRATRHGKGKEVDTFLRNWTPALNLG